MLELFEGQIQRLTVDEWMRIYDARPLGYGSGSRIPLIDRDGGEFPVPWETKERLVGILEQTLGGSAEAEKRGDGRVNFLSYCMERLQRAVDAIGDREILDADSFVAGYGPFLPVIPPAAVGISDDIAELWDPSVRTAVLDRYAELLTTLAGRETAADAHLTDDAARISLAICLESVGATSTRRTELEEMYLTLCAFPRVAAGSPSGGPDPVRSCENSRLSWLGYEPVLPEGQRLRIGAGMVRAVAKRTDDAVILAMGGGLLLIAGVVVATFIATGGRLDLPGYLGAVVVGSLGPIVGVPIYLKLSGPVGSSRLQRALAVMIAVVLMIGVTAALSYFYIGFVTR